MGASWWGDGEHNCARCVDRAGEGAKGWGEKPWNKKKKGGDTSITCAPSDPSLPLSLHGQTRCLRGGAHFHRQMHNPLLCSRQRLHLFPRGANLIATISRLMCLSFISGVRKFQFSWKILSERLIFLMRIYVWSGNMVMRYQIKDIQQNRKKKKKTTNYPSSSLKHIQQVTCSCHTLFCCSRLCSYSKWQRLV